MCYTHSVQYDPAPREQGAVWPAGAGPTLPQGVGLRLASLSPEQQGVGRGRGRGMGEKGRMGSGAQRGLTWLLQVMGLAPEPQRWPWGGRPLQVL